MFVLTVGSVTCREVLAVAVALEVPEAGSSSSSSGRRRRSRIVEIAAIVVVAVVAGLCLVESSVPRIRGVIGSGPYRADSRICIAAWPLAQIQW